jgi:hypothetical protein
MLALFNAPLKAAPILELVLADPTASEAQKTNATDQLAILRKRALLNASNSAATPSTDSSN